MGIFSKLRGKKVIIEVASASELVNRLKWAETEVSDAHDALLGLEYRLEHGKQVMVDIADEAAAIIAHHEDILKKANERRNEFAGQSTQVQKIRASIETIYQEAEVK